MGHSTNESPFIERTLIGFSRTTSMKGTTGSTRSTAFVSFPCLVFLVVVSDTKNLAGLVLGEPACKHAIWIVIHMASAET